MLKFILAPALALGLLAIPLGAKAKPGGCLKYGTAGAVAGHYAGHHGVMGAVTGCALGIHKRREIQARNAHAAPVGGADDDAALRRAGGAGGAAEHVLNPTLPRRAAATRRDARA
jgi:hypothetical protein